MSGTVWLRLMVMSASAGLVAMIVRPRRRAVSPRLAGLSQWAPSIDARPDGIRSRVSNGSRAEAGADNCGSGRERDDCGESCGGSGAVSAEGGDVTWAINAAI